MLFSRMKVLIVPDKFKGTLTASDAAQAIRNGWLESRPEDQTELLPMSDGGDGFADILGGLLKAEAQSTETVDAAHRPCISSWYWLPSSRTAIVESARTIGLALLPPKQFHPFELDTFGLAAVMRAAAEKGALHCVLGIGGSATNDGGFGMARGLGWEFLNTSAKPIERWTDLHGLAEIRSPAVHLPFETVVAVDVANPLLGPTGCTRVYGPQKGLRPEDFNLAEGCLERLADVLQQLKLDHAKTPGAGAAGGLGYGLMCFAKAKAQSGFAIFAEYAELRRRIQWADIVITAEGAIDESTLMGKGVGAIASLCRQLNVPCLGLAGVMNCKGASVFTATHAIAPELATQELAMAEPAKWLSRLAARTASRFSKADLSKNIKFPIDGPKQHR